MTQRISRDAAYGGFARTIKGVTMPRTEGDTWDLATSVGATATMVAAARAAATRRTQPVITDQFAEPLVRAVGIDLFPRRAAGELDALDVEGGVGFPRMIDTFAARARFYDDYFAEATAAGLRQVVIVASGLDARPYRLSWPAGTTVYEIDQPEVIEFKTATLAKLGAVPGAAHRTVGIDLREDWPAALQAAGFDTAQPTAWLAEGVLIGFLPPEAEVRLLDNIVSLSSPGSRLSADYGHSRSRRAVRRRRAGSAGGRRPTGPGQHDRLRSRHPQVAQPRFASHSAWITSSGIISSCGVFGSRSR